MKQLTHYTKPEIHGVMLTEAGGFMLPFFDRREVFSLSVSGCAESVIREYI